MLKGIFRDFNGPGAGVSVKEDGSGKKGVEGIFSV